MTERPEIKVGQKWVTRGGGTVRILATDADGDTPIVGQYQRDAEGFFAFGTWRADGTALHNTSCDLISLAPSTVKREVALYSDSNGFVTAFECDEQPDDYRKMISEPLTIEFTLLPGESAE